MEKWFRRSIILMGFMFFLFIAILFATVFFPSIALLDSLGVALICMSPLVFIFALITGLGSLFSRFQGRSQQKAKREYGTSMFYEDEMLEQIMSRLSLEERAYLRERLASRELALGEDGELLSLDELMQDKQKRDWE